MDDAGRAAGEADGAGGPPGGRLGRRARLAAAVAAAGGAAVAAMTGLRRARTGGGEGSVPAPPARGRLLARPGAPTGPAPPPGVHPLGLSPGRHGLLYVPARHRPGVAAPLVVSLHGAGGDAEAGLALWRDVADAAGLVVVAPASRRRTWDVLVGGFGPDVAFLDAALGHVLRRVEIDSKKVAISGFSDGASYALSLGLGNGDLFTHCAAFSPGFVAELAPQDRPRCFVSHGLRDTVLPIDSCSRRIVPALRHRGYDVDYREFDGGHTVPADQVAAATAWLTAP